MKSKERANLRAEAARLDPIVHVGHAGATDALVESLENALRTRELVKIDVSRNLETPIRDMATSLAASTGAEVVQVIGRKVTLYRENPDLDWKKKSGTPPWR